MSTSEYLEGMVGIKKSVTSRRNGKIRKLEQLMLRSKTLPFQQKGLLSRTVEKKFPALGSPSAFA
jgi:hypothetical protein